MKIDVKSISDSQGFDEELHTAFCEYIKKNWPYKGNAVWNELAIAPEDMDPILAGFEPEKEAILAKRRESKRAEEIRMRSREEYGDMLATPGAFFEGYRIKEYLGCVSGEYVLGTGIVSSIGASLSDLAGTNSELYSDKISEAKRNAQMRIYENMLLEGGNAVIGIRFNFLVFGTDMIGVCVTGVAVQVEKE